jgi:hypothetical protein
MAEMKFLFHGRKSDIDAMLVELSQLPEVASVSSKEVLQAPSILNQSPQRQFELYDAIVSIVLSIASSTAYEGIKAAIALLTKKRGIRADEAPKVDETPNDDNTKK